MFFFSFVDFKFEIEVLVSLIEGRKLLGEGGWGGFSSGALL